MIFIDYLILIDLFNSYFLSLSSSGIYSDRVANFVRGEGEKGKREGEKGEGFTITPRKGDYLLLSKSQGNKVKRYKRKEKKRKEKKIPPYLSFLPFPSLFFPPPFSFSGSFSRPPLIVGGKEFLYPPLLLVIFYWGLVLFLWMLR